MLAAQRACRRQREVAGQMNGGVVGQRAGEEDGEFARIVGGHQEDVGDVAAVA